MVGQIAGPLTLAARPLGPWVLSAVFFRSFFLQALWNFQRMQNLGWLFSLWPALRRLYPEAGVRSRVAGEHIDYFNTHPYLANIVLGTVAGLEEDYARGGPVRREQILAAKKYMSGPLAALGDTLFWATARPLFGALAIAVGLGLYPGRVWAVPVIFLALHNALHLLARAGGLWAGYRLKAQVVSFLMRLNPQGVVRGAVFLGIGLCIGLFGAFAWGFGPGRIWAAVFAAGAFAALRRGLSITRLFYVYAAAAVAAGLLLGV